MSLLNKSSLSSYIFVALIVTQGVLAIFDKALKCRDDECDILGEHFSLYSRVKQAFDNGFDFRNGTEMIGFANSIRILDQRYNYADTDQNDQQQQISGANVIRKKILDRPEFSRALATLGSDEAQDLIDLYRVKLNDKKYTTSCSSERISRFNRAERKLNHNDDLKWMFQKLHDSFVTRSALKCLKYSCKSVNLAMIMINPEATKWSTESPIAGSIDREFKAQELAICQFITGTNDNSCKTNANELAQFKLDNSKQNLASLKAYSRNIKKDNNNNNNSNNQSEDLEASKVHIQKQCQIMDRSLNEALSGLKWYSAQQKLSSQQIETRRYWCPDLSYWIEVDRICKELPKALESVDTNIDNKMPDTTIATISVDKIDSNEI